MKRRREVTLCADRRALWRTAGTLALGCLLAAWPLEATAAPLLLAAPGLALAGIAFWSALGRTRPLLTVRPDGLDVHAAVARPGAKTRPCRHALSWEDVARIDVEERGAAGRTAVCVRLHSAAPRSDGHRGFLEALADPERAVRDDWRWNASRQSIDLVARPRGGHARVLAAIAGAQPSLSSPGLARRLASEPTTRGDVFDGVLAAALAGTLVLWALGGPDRVAELARRAAALVS